MPELIVLSVGAASFGLIAIILAAASWLQRRISVLLSLLLVLAAVWLLVLKIGIFNYAWQTNISMHRWPRLFSEIAGKAALLLAALSCAVFTAGRQAKKTASHAGKLGFCISACLVLAAIAHVFFTPTDFTDRILGLLCTVWISAQLSCTSLSDRADKKTDGTLNKYSLAAIGAIGYAITSIFLGALRIDQAWAVLALSLLLSAFVLAFGLKHFIGPLHARKDQKKHAEISGVNFGETFGLTARETEIVCLIVEGNSNNNIAEKLFISPKTVESHLYNIFRKMNVSSRVQVVSQVLGSPK